MMLTRRDVLVLSAGGLAATLLPVHGATPLALDELIAAFTGGRAPAPGRVRLDIMDVAENGFIVPVSIRVDGAMTGDDRVDAVALFAEANPLIHIATFRFSSLSAEAFVATRIRLARTQTVRAVARLEDGRCFVGERRVEVVVGGCGAP